MDLGCRFWAGRKDVSRGIHRSWLQGYGDWL